MGLIKNEIPILERDTNKEGIIMPNPKNEYQFPQKCVFAFLGDDMDEYFYGFKEVIGTYKTITKKFDIYKTIYKGEEVCFCQGPLGASAATQLMEFLIACGVKYIIACGSCGVLLEIDENEIVIPTEALRDEGTSYHYVEPSREIVLDKLAVNVICTVANKHNIKYELCKTWTTDGFYRETKDMVKYRISEGCSVVEMECSALAACAKFRNVTFGQFFYTADSLANVEKYDKRGWGHSSVSKAFFLAIESVFYLDKVL